MKPVVSLLFEPAGRPTAEVIGAIARENRQFGVSIDAGDGADSPDSAHRWVELLASGLTFDLVGLAPGHAAPVVGHSHAFGLPPDFNATELAAVSLSPGPHLSGARVMAPVVRCLAWLAAQLADLPGLKAVAWHSARTCCGPDYFRTAVLRWMDGGAFPGLGLTSLDWQPDGSLTSRGLALFTGQELRIESHLAQEQAETAKIALRLLHWLVENGRLDQPVSLTGPAGETLSLEPQREPGIVRVWRGSR